ncbi:DNA gyrase subunit B [Streptomyces sp. NBC_00059]|uniref:DNA gyrase subunit B n=1 Tax=Streptomyces sp. NBC_00059 TaxID=2975635 RepID=UPI0022508C57|nr:DNA gyrase subunit B [Streptomyces sp. NBC_00059]MCX5415840.1 DNA gyrase subunit B [Streptomyces sp. NBC_00059]
MSGETTGYDAARTEELEGREGIRKRPGMWVGSTGERGLHEMVFQVVGRAMNNALAGQGGGSVDVTLTRDGGVRISDNGPVTAARDTGGTGLEAPLTSMPAEIEVGGPIVYMGHGRTSGELYLANVLSSRLTAEVRCGGTRRVQAYARGVATAPPAAMGSAAGSGTTVTFWPDTEIFETTRCSFAVLAERLRQVAFLNRGLGLSLTDERAAGGARAVSFRFPDGVRDFVEALDAEAGPVFQPDVISFEREDPRMAGTMEVALLWGGSHQERIRSFANSRATRQGGTHVDGFRDGVAAVVTAYARARGLPDAVGGSWADGIGEGLTAVVSVKLEHPEYHGATRELLGNPEVQDCVAEAVREHLGNWLRDRPTQAAQLLDGILRNVPQD